MIRLLISCFIIVCAIASHAQTAFPIRTFSPYADFTIRNPTLPNLITISRRSGVKSFHLAFIIDGGTCQPTWLHETKKDIVWRKNLLREMRHLGIAYIISFGGPVSRDLSTRCDQAQLAAAYEKIYSTYQPAGLDFDIEHPEVDVTKIIAALKEFQKKHASLYISLTLPVLPGGLTDAGKKIIEQAKQEGLHYFVNIMAMNYGKEHNTDTMGKLAIAAATNTHEFLKSLYAEEPSDTLWQKIEITPMIGVNSIQEEAFTLTDVAVLREFAQQNGIGRLSMWSINRDHPCADTRASAHCSGNNLQTKSYEFAQRFLS